MERRPTRIAGLLCIIFASLALFAATARGQGLVQSDVLPVLGDSWHMQALQTVPPEPPLTHDILWEYGNLVGNDLFGVTHTIVAPSTVAGSAAYPDTDRAIRNDPDNGSTSTHTFFNVMADRCLDLGTLGEALATNAHPGSLAHAYPLELGEHVESTYCYSAVTSSGTTDFCGTSRIEIIGSGTLVLPFGTYTNVQLVSTRNAAALAEDGTDSTITIIHDWYAPGIPYPLLHFTQFINPNGSSSRAGQILDEASLVGISEHKAPLLLPSFPNPTSGSLTIVSDGPGSLDVIGADGRLVRTDAFNSTGQHALDLSGLPEGIYQLIFRGTGPQRTAKVVVAH